MPSAGTAVQDRGVLALALFLCLLLAPIHVAAQEAVGIAIAIRGTVQVERSGVLTPFTQGPVFDNDRIATLERAEITLSLFGRALLRAGESTTFAIGGRASQRVVRLDTGTIAYANDLRDSRTIHRDEIRTANTVGHVFDGVVIVTTDPLVPQVPEGSFVALTEVCHADAAISWLALEGAERRRQTKKCVTFIEDWLGTVTPQPPGWWSSTGPSSFWARERDQRWLLRVRLGGTERWSRNARAFSEQDRCETAAARQRDLGRHAVCWREN